MAGSNIFMNFSDVTCTPQPSGTAIVISEITDVSVDTSQVIEKWRASGRHYASLVVGTDRERTVTIQTGDMAKVEAIDPNGIYTLTWTMKDARNGLGSGALVHTLVNAVKSKSPYQAAHNKYGKGTITFDSFATADADPLTIVQTP